MLRYCLSCIKEARQFWAKPLKAFKLFCQPSFCLDALLKVKIINVKIIKKF